MVIEIQHNCSDSELGWMKIVLILLLIYQNHSVEHLMAAGFVFIHCQQEVFHLMGFFFTLNIEIEKKKHMLNLP